MNRVCDVVTKQFVFGVERCGKPATSTLRCERLDCAVHHPVCPDHGGDPYPPSGS